MSADDDDLLSGDALAAAVAASRKSKASHQADDVAKQDRRRKAGPFSVRASVRKTPEGEILTLRNMFWAFHHPESGGQYSSNIYIAGPSLLPTLLTAALVGYATYWAASAMQMDLMPVIVLTSVVTLLSMLVERFWAHRKMDVQISGGNFAIYRNGRKKPFVMGPRSDLKLGAYGVERYRRIRFLFPLKSLLSGEVEHDIYLQPVPSDVADLIDAFARRMGVEG